MWSLSCVDIFVPFQVIDVQKSFSTIWAPMSLFSIMPPQMHIQLSPSGEFLFTEVTVEWFLSCVNPYVGFDVPL